MLVNKQLEDFKLLSWKWIRFIARYIVLQSFKHENYYLLFGTLLLVL